MIIIAVVLISFLIGALLILLFGFGTKGTPNATGGLNDRRTVQETRNTLLSKTKRGFHHVNTLVTVSPSIQTLVNQCSVKSDGTSVITISIEKDIISNDDKDVFFSQLLQQLISICPIIILQKASTNEEQESIKHWFNQQSNQSIPNHRLLFYSTKIGKIAFLRQLKPALHIEYDAHICTEVSQFMRVLLIQNTLISTPSSSLISTYGQYKLIHSFNELLVS